MLMAQVWTWPVLMWLARLSCFAKSIKHTVASSSPKSDRARTVNVFSPVPVSVPVISQALPSLAAVMLKPSRVRTRALLLTASIKKHSVMGAPSSAFATMMGSAKGVMSIAET